MPRDLRVTRLQDCAVVYVIAAPALSTIAKPMFEFPPAYSKRLYLQKGLFADFGPYPGDAAVKEGLENYKASWSWLQQNCQRIFFPRTYPAIEGADELRNNQLMEGDAFLKDLTKSIASGASGDLLTLEHRPPWLFNADDAQGYGKASAEMALRIDAYLRRAALVQFEEDGDLLDPLLVGLLRRDVAPELGAIDRLAEATEQPGLLWIRDRLNRARAALEVINLACSKA
jgi:hypothetical protein